MSRKLGFGFSQQTSRKSVFDSEESSSQQQKPPPALDSFFEETSSKPKKRKLVKLDEDDDLLVPEELEEFDGEQKQQGPDENDDFVGDLDDERGIWPKTSTGIKGFVPQGYNASQQIMMNFDRRREDQSSAAGPPVSKQQEDDEDDPLDAFMVGIDDIVQKESRESITREEKVRRDDIEDEDFVESYVNHMKKKGIEVGKNQRLPIEKDENANSDDEVYATARAIDAQLEYDSDDNPIVEQKRKDVEPLPAIDHSQIQYPEIEKYFYEEHPDIAALSEDRVHMHVSGADVAKPCISFAHFGFDDALLDSIIKYGYSEPTGIQKQAVPVALSGRDIIGIAKTGKLVNENKNFVILVLFIRILDDQLVVVYLGSGKTAAFIWPMLVHIMDQGELDKGEGSIGLILAPTRELANQIYIEAKKFAKSYSLRVAAVYGGASKMDQFKELRSGGVEILVGTPGRLIDMVKMKATNFRRVSFLVLDEADRMFDLGFEPQVRSICDNLRPDRQTLLFSATFPKKVERLAREVTVEPVRISIGNVGQANTDITQVTEILADDSYKWDWLMKHLVRLCVEGSVLIFVSRKGGVDELSLNLQSSGHQCGALHGDLMQSERDKVLREFKQNKFPILVATDVAARGLDIKTVKTVINYDIARDIDLHVHRIGRTGRAGEKGTAYTLITKKEDKFAGDLVRNLESSGQPVPSDLLELAMQNNRFRKTRQRGTGTSANAMPLGGTPRLGGGGGAEIPPPPQLTTSSSGSSTRGSGLASRFQMNFQRATTSAPALGSLHTQAPSTSSPSGFSSNTANKNNNADMPPTTSSSSTTRKRRWDT
ncbi:1427_t:CDS:10 [Ambispora gerdemannii]|uniref:RNA helicase n=1 Tax=Ambispora gerdemannii TaxID=144530 RepID=A0A9N9BT52_9GLOM|nr:1427_t:CDS:10 [Ambispora gerdemannii]